MFPTLIRRVAQSAKESLPKQVPFSLASNPHKARKLWPPDFKELTHQQQLRFEKKYKRRVALASRSPRWDKGVKYAQLATMAAAMLRKHAINLFGVLDPEKRYERRKDAPEVNPSRGSDSK
ncbi:hypothetical protein ACHAPV_005242 [Trichoderma viride]